MRRNKRERQELLQQTIQATPFITDEELAGKFGVSIQTIRLDRLELSIPELRERIKNVAEKTLEDEVKSLSLDEVIGEIIDLELDDRSGDIHFRNKTGARVQPESDCERTPFICTGEFFGRCSH